MAGQDRTQAYALILRMMERPYSYDFFQAVRRIENAEGKARPGESARLADDPVRFGQEPSLAFPASTIASFHAGGAAGAHRMRVNFFGLLGPNGPLPLHLTDYARDRDRNAGDATLARFLDVFHHRMISLFYRAWAVCQPTASFDRAEADPGADRMGVYVASLIGLGTPSLRDRDELPDLAKLHHAGRLADQSRCPEGLECAVSDFFRVPCRLIEFVGRWLELPPGSRLRLGESPASGSLGVTSVVGSRVWDVQQTFRLRLGPLTLREYERFLPGGRSFARLAAWVRNYAGFEYAWDAQLVLSRAEVPQTSLGRAGRLGWTTWLNSGAAARDADDLILAGPDASAPQRRAG